MSNQEQFETMWLEFNSDPKAWWAVASEEERAILWDGFSKLYFQALFDLLDLGKTLLAVESEKLGQPLMEKDDILSILGRVKEKYG